MTPVQRAGSAVRKVAAVSALLALVAALPGCGYGSKAKADDNLLPAAGGAKLSIDQVRIGYQGHTTHVTPIVGIAEGLLQRELGGTRIERSVFNDGSAQIEALNAGSVDIAWIGPSPALNGWSKSQGRSLRIISGAASGGASLVVKPDRISTPDDVLGSTVATPQLGNTQDVALLDWIRSKGWQTDARSGRGDVNVIRQSNGEIPVAFRRGDVDGAWVAEPTASRLVAAGGKVLVQEKDLWENGAFVTTNVIVSQRFLKDHPDVVTAVLRGSLKTNAWIKAHPGRAKTTLNAALGRLTGKPLPPDVLTRAFRNVRTTNDPLASTLEEQMDNAVATGLLRQTDLQDIYDLRLLNKVLRAEGEPPVSDAGLGVGDAP